MTNSNSQRENVQSAKVPFANQHFPSFAPQGGRLQKKMDEAIFHEVMIVSSIYNLKMVLNRNIAKGVDSKSMVYIFDASAGGGAGRQLADHHPQSTSRSDGFCGQGRDKLFGYSGQPGKVGEASQQDLHHGGMQRHLHPWTPPQRLPQVP